MSTVKNRLINALTPYFELRELAKSPNYAYALKEHIRKKYHISPNYSTWYATLWMLEKQGYLEAEVQPDPKRRRKFITVYTITAKGREYLKKLEVEIRFLFS